MTLDYPKTEQSTAWQEQVDQLLAQGFPPTPSPEADQWRNAFQEIGAVAIPYLEDKLRAGTVDEQYAAIPALRALGVRADADGFWENMIFYVQRPGEEERVIEPIQVERNELS